MTEQTSVGTSPQDQQVVITRIFDAPRQIVFEAWTDAEQVARWWGPNGFHTPPETVEIDLRVGGRYHLSMVRGETGASFPLRSPTLATTPPPRPASASCSSSPWTGRRRGLSPPSTSAAAWPNPPSRFG
jgi:hypothetical protein